jgi:hypothetical protein
VRIDWLRSGATVDCLKRILEALPFFLTVVSKMDVFPVVFKDSILSPIIVFSNSRSILIRSGRRITFTATVPNNAPKNSQLYTPIVRSEH